MYEDSVTFMGCDIVDYRDMAGRADPYGNPKKKTTGFTGQRLWGQRKYMRQTLQIRHSLKGA